VLLNFAVLSLIVYNLTIEKQSSRLDWWIVFTPEWIALFLGALFLIVLTIYHNQNVLSMRMNKVQLSIYYGTYLAVLATFVLLVLNLESSSGTDDDGDKNNKHLQNWNLTFLPIYIWAIFRIITLVCFGDFLVDDGDRTEIFFVFY
jgi:hypothetical protein